MEIKKKKPQLERIRQGGSNFGGHSAKGIKHGARGRNLDETEHMTRYDHNGEV